MKIDDLDYKKALHLATYSEGSPHEYPDEVEVWRVCEALKVADAEVRRLRAEPGMVPVALTIEQWMKVSNALDTSVTDLLRTSRTLGEQYVERANANAAINNRICDVVGLEEIFRIEETKG